MAKFTTDATTFDEFDRWLGDKTTRKLAHNTYVERVGADIAVRYHSTFIVTYHPDGSLTLNTGGWRTTTTKARIHDLIGPGRFLSSTDGVWNLTRSTGPWPAPREQVSEFYDGMTIDADGNMVTAVLVDSGREMRRLKQQIRGYVNLYSDERVAELVAHAAENGTAGDCWLCAMVTTDGQALGDAQGDTDHLLEHIREGYTMASVMLNAVKRAGYREPAVILHHAPDLVRKAIRRMLVETLTTSHGARPQRDGNAEHWG